MKRFRFSLERVLDVREIQSVLVLQSLGEARVAAGQAAAALEEARGRRSSYAVSLEERRRQGMAAWEWAVTSTRHEALSRAEQEATQALQRALETVSLRQAELEGARQREKALQHLKGVQLEAFRLADAAADQAVNDELAQRFARRERRVN